MNEEVKNSGCDLVPSKNTKWERTGNHMATPTAVSEFLGIRWMGLERKKIIFSEHLVL